MDDTRDYYKECQNILYKLGINIDIKSDYLIALTHESYIVMAEKNVSFNTAIMRVKSNQYYKRKTAPEMQEIDNTVSIENDSIDRIENIAELVNVKKMIETGRWSDMSDKVKHFKAFYLAKINELLESEV